MMEYGDINSDYLFFMSCLFKTGNDSDSPQITHIDFFLFVLHSWNCFSHLLLHSPQFNVFLLLHLLPNSRYLIHRREKGMKMSAMDWSKIELSSSILHSAPISATLPSDCQNLYYFWIGIFKKFD